MLIGETLGPYRVLSKVGEGGMGEVYRGRDSRLDRDVALKILPGSFAADADRLMRFEREAKTLASLNHPNIAQIYGTEECGGVRALVMELVDGDDLSVRIARGPIPLDEALPIARQIAEALEAAHEQGIVHRDLKPANVKVRPDGTVKVLDFGLAKALSTDPAGATDVDGLPGGGQRGSSRATFTSPAFTQMGVILGTAAYMSPEQARGQAVDRRADVWAFGSVLFEMLTGRRPFPGDTVSDIIASVLAREPDLAVLPPSVPPRLVELLRRCLEKTPRKRWQAIGDVRHELEMIAEGPQVPATQAASKRPLWRRAWPVVAGVAGGVALVLALGAGTRVAETVPVSRLLIDAPNRTGHIAISPDGSRMAIVTGQRLMVRALADFTEVPVAGVDFTGLSNPVFSPNGESIVFSVGESIRRVPVGGGVATEIARVAEPPLGLSWDGDSLLAGIGAGGIARLPLDGGAATTLVTLGPSEFAARPQMLPGGKDVLFTFTSGGQRPDWRTSSVVVQSLESGKRDVLVQTGSDGRYVPTGHLVYAVEGVWFGAAFDPRERRLTGLPAPLISGVGRFHRAGVVEPNAMVAFSDNGTLVYGTGPVTLTRRRELVRTDRAGTEQSLKLPPNSYESPRVSPNGKLLAVSAGEGADATVWIYDLSGATALRRLTFSGSNRLPVWAPDGTRVAFQSEGGGGAPGIFVRRVDGSGDAERLTTAEPGTTHVPESWSTDGWLAYSKVTNTGAELWLYSEREKRAMQFGTVQSSDPLNASFSPDGKWLAYTQRWATRTAHVFVQPVPATGALYQISPEGNMGHHPLWSPLGDELLYMGVRGSRMVSTQMTFGSGLSFSNPVPLTPNLPSNTSARGPLAYGITADGRAFIWAKPLDAAVAERDALRVVLGWFSELKRPLPGSR